MKSFYEKTQNFNKVTKFLHSTRYKNLEKIFQALLTLSDKPKVVDIGCAFGKSFEVLNNISCDFTYHGVEIRQDFVDIATERYSKHPNFDIRCCSVTDAFDLFSGADLIIGLETLEHIPENLVVDTLEAIAKSDFKYCYFTVPNEIGPAIMVKNIGSLIMGYIRHREYTWAQTLYAGFYKLDALPRHTTAHIGFDWRWLAQTIRHNMVISQRTKSPFQWIPSSLSPSIGFICNNDDILENKQIKFR